MSTSSSPLPSPSFSSFQITFDAPRRRGGIPVADPVVTLSRCATLGDVHRSFPDVRSILVSCLGPASAHGATKPVIRSFARLLLHPLGPSVAAEALALVTTAVGLVPAPALAKFFDLAAATASSRRPIDAGHRSLFRDRLAEFGSPKRRAAALTEWWTEGHDEGCSWKYDLSRRVRWHRTWTDVTPVGWLAAAPGVLLMDHLPWMPAAICEEVGSHPLLFEDREVLDGLAWLAVHHRDAVVANPLCPAFVARELARLELPLAPAIDRPPKLDPRESARRDWEYATSDLCYDERPSWTNRAVRLGWMTLPALPCDSRDRDAHRALVAAMDRPSSHLFHAAGQLEGPMVQPHVWLQDPVDGEFAARMADAFHGRRLHADGVWQVTALRTHEAVWANARRMENCTARYYGPPEEYGSVLLVLDDGARRLNASVERSAGGDWRLRAINSRFNSGDVPSEVMRVLAGMIVATAERIRAGSPRRGPVMCHQCGTERVAVGRVCLSCRAEDAA